MDQYMNNTSLINHTLKVRRSPAGFHLFNRLTGANLLVDEVIPPSDTWSKAPRHVSVALTNACDLECPHCYAPKNPSKLPFDELITWLGVLDENQSLGVGFGGGEPTLYPNLPKLCDTVSKTTKLAITMTTHGHRLSDQLLNELAGNLNFIRISMDGVGETYQLIRNRPFDTLLNRLIAVSRLIPFGINFIVNQTTFHDINEAVRIAEDMGAKEFLILPEEPVGGSGGIDRATEKGLHVWGREYRGGVPLAISDGRHESLPVSDALKAEKGLMAFAHIDALGILKKTSYDTEGIRIKDYGIISALEKLGSNRPEYV
jgi:sulfatase maturation enzyme AslB (radical SAM superfamily)